MQDYCSKTEKYRIDLSVEGKAGKNNWKRGVYPRLHKELGPAEGVSPPHSPPQNHSLERQNKAREIAGSIRLHTTKFLKADASSIIHNFEGHKTQILRTFCPGNIFEVRTETLKTLFVLQISQKTKRLFTSCTNTHYPARKYKGRWKRHRGERKVTRGSTDTHTLLDLPSRRRAASPSTQGNYQTNSSLSGMWDLTSAQQLLCFSVTGIRDWSF